MQLLELPDPLGKKPSMWVNVDHVVSVMPMYRNTGTAITAEAEVKLEGMPLHRVGLGDHATTAQAEEAFESFLRLLQAG